MADTVKIGDQLHNLAEQVDELERDRFHMEKEIVCLLRKLGGKVVLTDEELAESGEYFFLAHRYEDDSGVKGRHLKVFRD